MSDSVVGKKRITKQRRRKIQMIDITSYTEESQAVYL